MALCLIFHFRVSIYIIEKKDAVQYLDFLLAGGLRRVYTPFKTFLPGLRYCGALDVRLTTTEPPDFEDAALCGFLVVDARDDGEETVLGVYCK
jgi:hypothetical protein